MFVLRSKVKIEDASPRLARIGLVGEGAAALVARHWGVAPAAMASTEKDGATCVALETDRFVAIVPAAAAAPVLERLAGGAAPGGADDWRRAAIPARSATILPATPEAV